MFKRAVGRGIVDDQDLAVIVAQDGSRQPIQNRRQRGLSVVRHDKDQQSKSIGAHFNDSAGQHRRAGGYKDKISLTDLRTNLSDDAVVALALHQQPPSLPRA
jgi:hypothetical protein